ncbi:MAG: ribosomal protein S18-alanine N-acetyltransferase [candidate division WOR-3 bacterium]
MEIRPARPEDIEPIMAIERASFVGPWSRNAFVSELVKAGTRFWVLDDGEIVGYLVAWDMVDYLYVANIAIREDRRGEGLGKALLQRCIDEARQTGRAAIVLDVRVSNQRARRFYEGLGFVQIRYNPRFYGTEDGITYALRL